VSSQAEEEEGNGAAHGSRPTTQDPDLPLTWAGSGSTQADGNADGIADGSPSRKRPGDGSALGDIEESSSSSPVGKRLRGALNGEVEEEGGEGKGGDANERNENGGVGRDGEVRGENGVREEGGTPGKGSPSKVAVWDEDATQATDSAFKPKARPDNDIQEEEEDYGATQMDGAFGGAEANEEDEDENNEDEEMDEEKEENEAEKETHIKEPTAEAMVHMQDDDDVGGEEKGGERIEGKNGDDEDEEKLHTQPGSRNGSQRSPSLKLDNSTAESPSEPHTATLERGYTVGGAQVEESFASQSENEG